MKKKRIYYKSDFIIQERHESGYNVPFRFFYYSASKSRYHLASFDGQNYEGCRLSEDGQTLIVPVDNKDLGVGILMVYRHYFLNNDMFEDNLCDRFVPAQPVMDTSLGELSVVELTNEDEGTVDIYSEVMPYYAQGPKGEQGPQGLQGEQGPQGPKGEDGYTPQRGVDYWTEEDETKLTEAKRIAQEALGMASDVGDVANYAKLTAEEAVRKGDSAIAKTEDLQGSVDRAMIGIECHDIMNYGQSVTLPEGYIMGSTITCRMARAQTCMEGESYVTIGYDPTTYPLYWNDNPAGLHETWHDGDVIEIRVDANLMRADAKPWKLSEGPQGPKGEPGYTPQRGVDYWTAEDEAKLAEAKQTAEEALRKGNSAIEKTEQLQGGLDRAMIGIVCHDIMNEGQNFNLPEGYIIGSVITCRMASAMTEGESYVTIGNDPTQYWLLWLGNNGTWEDGEPVQICVIEEYGVAYAQPWANYALQTAEEANAKAEEANAKAMQADAKAEAALDLIDWYGIERDTTISNSKCKRIGNLNLHRDLPLQSMMRCCLLNDDGSVNYYLKHDDSRLKEDGTQADLTGRDGMLMVELPDMWVRFERDGTKFRAKIATRELPGFHLWRGGYISSVEATVQRSTNKLASVCSTDADFRGGNNDASRDGTYRTMLGMPATEISLDGFRTYARNRGSANWNCYLYRLHKMLFWLYAVEYANLNSQDDFNAELDASGYHQGGLGDGVTTWGLEWSSFNGYYPIVPCGVTNSLGNHTGTVDYNVIGSDGATIKTFAVPRYRGIENPFGHFEKFVDGCKCIIQSNASGGLSKFYVCDDPSKFTASGVDNYAYRGNLTRERGYIKDIILGEDGEIMASKVGGSSHAYFCDNFVTKIPSSGEDERCIILSGKANSSFYAGFVYEDTSVASSKTANITGTRLCYDPQAGTTTNQ